jgi:hypothetical protein
LKSSHVVKKLENEKKQINVINKLPILLAIMRYNVQKKVAEDHGKLIQFLWINE